MTVPRDRFRGCLLGGAVGDALGGGIFGEHGEGLVRGYADALLDLAGIAANLG